MNRDDPLFVRAVTEGIAAELPFGPGEVAVAVVDRLKQRGLGAHRQPAHASPAPVILVKKLQ